jgi:hypothetical protein
VGAVIWSGLLLVGATVYPAYVGGGGRSVGGKIVTFTSTSTLLAVNGPRIMILLGVPLVLSVVCYLTWRATDGRGLRWPSMVALICVGIVALETVISLTSIGLFLLPVVGLLIVGWNRRRQLTPS